MVEAQNISIPPTATERLGGDVSYYEETTYNLWSIRLTSGDGTTGEQTVQTIKRPQETVCHNFNDQGKETVITRYVQRDSNVGSIGRDNEGNIDFIVNNISRISPDTRTVVQYDSTGCLYSINTWSYNLGDSSLIRSDTCIYDSAGQLTVINMQRDSLPSKGAYHSDDRNGSYHILYEDGTMESCRYDTDGFLIRYTDRDGMFFKYLYNERGNLAKQTSEWKDGGVLNIIFEDYEYDEYGNWTRCVRKVKDPGEPPRSTKIIERTLIYR